MMDDLAGPVVIDTDVASFLFNQDPVRGPRYEAVLEDRTIYIPFAVIAELLFGAELRAWGPARRARLHRFLATTSRSKLRPISLGTGLGYGSTPRDRVRLLSVRTPG